MHESKSPGREFGDAMYGLRGRSSVHDRLGFFIDDVVESPRQDPSPQLPPGAQQPPGEFPDGISSATHHSAVPSYVRIKYWIVGMWLDYIMAIKETGYLPPTFVGLFPLDSVIRDFPLERQAFHPLERTFNARDAIQQGGYLGAARQASREGFPDDANELYRRATVAVVKEGNAARAFDIIRESEDFSLGIRVAMDVGRYDLAVEFAIMVSDSEHASP